MVTLSSSDTTEATVPATVTILANQTSANFDVIAVNDSFPDGNKTATITASAADATTPTFDVTVQDDGDVLQNNLMLTEVLSQQAAAGVSDFWELTNISGSAVSIAGYSWHDSGRSAATAASYALPVGSSIAPGESVIFTTISPTAFRTWWGISNSVQVFQTVGAPGLGQDDGVSFFDNGGNEIFFFSYAAAGFTKADGNPSTGTHAGPSAGAPTETRIHRLGAKFRHINTTLHLCHGEQLGWHRFCCQRPRHRFSWRHGWRSERSTLAMPPSMKATAAPRLSRLM